ncbi:MAG: murein biosynthesis integral membrane protein MurJ [Candidatus Endonucleobacter sp. (ex Gigantidas childressi)]|nr:murein biosynthesis integral membrane protein MurJ [Candidatus Endonucleobacter sp. (ex Gigantidas childressi)]
MPKSTPEQLPQKKHGLLRSSLLVGVMTMISRVLGLLRDVVIANYFGSTASADAFFVAFKIPNFMRRLFAEGAFSQAFVPVLSEYRTTKPINEIQNLVSRVSGTLAGTLIMVTVVCMLAAPLLVRVFAPGFYYDAAKMTLAGDMLRITFPYLFLISMTGLAGSVLNSYSRFAIPAFTPALLNLSLVGATLYLTPWFSEPIMALAWGVVIAGVAQLLLQLPFLLQIRMLPVPRWDPKHEGVRRIMTLMIPALFGVSVSQINLLLDTVLASFLPTGSVSWLYYSDRLSELPLGVLGIAIATVILPNLSQKYSTNAKESFSQTLDWAIRLVLLMGIPAGIALFILAEPLIATLFYYGEMTHHDVLMATASLRAYSLGLIAFMLIKVLAPGYFARQDIKTPVTIAIKTLVANMALNLALIFPLQHAGLALATTISAFMNASMLYFGLKKAQVFKPSKGWGRYSLQMLLANGTMIAVLLWLKGDVAFWLESSLRERVTQAIIVVISGLSVYAMTLWISGVRLKHFRH